MSSARSVRADLTPRIASRALIVAIFGCALFVNVNFFVRLISEQEIAFVQRGQLAGDTAESLPAASEKSETPVAKQSENPVVKAKASRILDTDKVKVSEGLPSRPISIPKALMTVEPEVKAKTNEHNDIYIKSIAQSLVRSLSDKDGIDGKDRMGFDVTLKNRNTNPHSTCHCDIISTDCLASIACIPHLHNPQYRDALAWIGVQMRRAMKAVAVFEGRTTESIKEIPVGKGMQYNTITVWNRWRGHNLLPKEYLSSGESIFVDEYLYPNCIDNDGTTALYKGFSCFFRGIQASELSTGRILESEAIQWFNDTATDAPTTKQQIRKLLLKFVRNHQPTLKNPKRGEFGYSEDVNESDFFLSPLGNLMMFAHLTLMMFNRRPFLDKIYQEKATSIGSDGQVDSSPNSNVRTAKSGKDDKEPFNVALHIRRGDSCNKEIDPKRYSEDASPLDSVAQMGNRRQCYKTKVYLDALRQIRRLVPKTRPLHVYLATDHVGSVIDEIVNKKFKTGNNSSAKEEVIEVERWHFLNYSRHHFDYDAESIESEDNRAHQPILGETAVADLWHLSHGHAFVGHMGSRFGKVAWLLATARYNTFIPFSTVDGHSKYSTMQSITGTSVSMVASGSIVW